VSKIDFCPFCAWFFGDTLRAGKSRFLDGFGLFSPDPVRLWNFQRKKVSRKRFFCPVKLSHASRCVFIKFVFILFYLGTLPTLFCFFCFMFVLFYCVFLCCAFSCLYGGDLFCFHSQMHISAPTCLLLSVVARTRVCLLTVCVSNSRQILHVRNKHFASNFLSNLNRPLIAQFFVLTWFNHKC